MSNIDKRALREAAEKATSGKWERGDGNGNGGELLVYCDDALGSAVCEMTSEYNSIPKYQRINNLNFIAAANPATVLALLDELEVAEKKTVEMPTFDGYVPHVARELQAAFRIACDNAGINIAAAGKGEAS